MALKAWRQPECWRYWEEVATALAAVEGRLDWVRLPRE